MLNRRSFLRTASLAGLGCGLTGCQSPVSEDRGMPTLSRGCAQTEKVMSSACTVTMNPVNMMILVRCGNARILGID